MGKKRSDDHVKKRDYFLCVLMLKCIHGLASHYLNKDVTMYVDIYMGMIQEVQRIWIYVYRDAPSNLEDFFV